MMRWWKLTGLAGACVCAIAASAAWAQTEGAAPSPSEQGSPAEQTAPASEAMRAMMREMMQEMMRQQRETGTTGPLEAERDDDDRPREGRDDMGARGMERRSGMMRGGPFGLRHGAHLRVMFAIVDANGDSMLSLQEVQDFHGRVFRAVDENGDGYVGMDEVQSFWRGRSDDNPR